MPWIEDKKADGGYKFVSHAVCKKCGKVIDDNEHILDSSGHYKCPKCGYSSRTGKTELQLAYESCTDDDLKEMYYNANPQEKRRITLELKRRNKR